jgi:phytoene dehydrogenase-like protein
MNAYVVIGGGLAGLTAANALAENGNKVTLLEQSRHLGGRAQTQQQSGFSLNLGPHGLYHSVAAQTLSAWNIPFPGNAPPTDSYSYFVRENRLYPLVQNFSSLMTTRLFNLREKLETARLLQLFAVGDAKGCRTMQEWLDQHIQSPRVQDVAATIVRITTYTTNLSRLSAKAALRQIGLALKHNVLYIDGGWQTLIEGLRRRAISRGVEICCDHPVSNLRDIAADGIVLAVGPSSVERLTRIALPKSCPLRMATLDIGLEKLPRNATRVAYAIDRPLYFSMHSASAQLAPEGGAMIHVAKYLGDLEPDPAAVREELEEYATLLLPEWRLTSRVARFLPNLIVTPMMASADGRPDVDFLGLENIAVAGDWVGDTGMLADAAVASALKAASVIQQRKVLVA